MPRLPTLLLAAASLAVAAAPVCPMREAQSGDRHVPLLELYTSEGCNSCPPADRWVGSLFQGRVAPQQVVPLAFHVDYWDDIGWRDRFADTRWSQRQDDRARQTGQATVFTPQLLLDGRDASSNPSGRLQKRWAEAVPASTSIHLQTHAAAANMVEADVTVQPKAGARPGRVYLALYENGLVSQVKAGENQGATLHHDAVVRALLGPWPLDGAGRLSRHASLPLAAGQRIEQSGVAAWVEGQDGQVWQALALACTP